MADQFVIEVFNEEKNRRVRFFKTTEDAYVFKEEIFWDAEPEDEGHVWGWSPFGITRSGLFDSLEHAKSEASNEIDWLKN